MKRVLHIVSTFGEAAMTRPQAQPYYPLNYIIRIVFVINKANLSWHARIPTAIAAATSSIWSRRMACRATPSIWVLARVSAISSNCPADRRRKEINVKSENIPGYYCITQYGNVRYCTAWARRTCNLFLLIYFSFICSELRNIIIIIASSMCGVRAKQKFDICIWTSEK